QPVGIPTVNRSRVTTRLNLNLLQHCLNVISRVIPMTCQSLHRQATPALRTTTSSHSFHGIFHGLFHGLKSWLPHGWPGLRWNLASKPRRLISSHCTVNPVQILRNHVTQHGSPVNIPININGIQTTHSTNWASCRPVDVVSVLSVSASIIRCRAAILDVLPAIQRPVDQLQGVRNSRGNSPSQSLRVSGRHLGCCLAIPILPVSCTPRAMVISRWAGSGS